MNIKIYIEGGGEGYDLDERFREGWTAFFEKAALQGRMPRPVRGKGRERTFDLYATAVRTRRENELPMLLVDSEHVPVDGHSSWQHLKARDGWERPSGAGDDDVFMMICSMETWFVADRATLKIFFEHGLRENNLPKWPELEAVPKERVFDALRKATAGCSRSYTKGRLSFELLKEIDPGEVESRCPAAKRLLDRLRSL